MESMKGRAEMESWEEKLEGLLAEFERGAALASSYQMGETRNEACQQIRDLFRAYEVAMIDAVPGMVSRYGIDLVGRYSREPVNAATCREALGLGLADLWKRRRERPIVE